MTDPKKILRDILSRHSDADKWIGRPFGRIKRLSNTKVGDVGQDFVEELCKDTALSCEFPLTPEDNRQRTESWNVRLGGRTFEIKTATEDMSGSFQFNHISYHRDYEGLLCIGVAPDDIFVDAWTKSDVVAGAAGNLVSMDKGSSATRKLTKRPANLHPIEDFEKRILRVLADLDKNPDNSIPRPDP